MSGYVPKRVSSTRTAIGTTDQKPEGSSFVMLGLVGGIGDSSWSRRVTKRRAYSSMLKKSCVEGKISSEKCNTITSTLKNGYTPEAKASSKSTHTKTHILSSAVHLDDITISLAATASSFLS